MISVHARAALCALAVSVSVHAQVAATSSARPAGLDLRYGRFDPVHGLPQMPDELRAGAACGLRIVQFSATPTQSGRDAIASVGGKIIGYLPHDAYVVRVDAIAGQSLRQLPQVRWVGAYHPAFRLDPELIAARSYEQEQAVRYDIVVADKHTDKPGLAEGIQAVGGTVDDLHAGGLLLTATLSGPQLLAIAHRDEVLWINRWSAPETDMNNARSQGGANLIEAFGGYSGAGVNAHIYEGVQANHPDFTGPVVNVQSSGTAQSHGHCTAGIVFGNGSSNSAVRGMAPDCGKFYTTYTSATASRWQVFNELVNIHNVSHTTASWGGNRTFFYNATSAAADDMVFDHDIAWTQSQSNAGNQDSRPEAWAKNVFSIGGVVHFNNASPGDDSWAAGNASIGPANDGRIKPTLCSYFDNIGTSDRTGGSGYSSGNWYSGFSGTSGATPIVAGHNVLAIELFTEEVSPGVGLFGNALRVPGGTSHQNRPHFPTLKALQVVSASQYSFSAGSSNNRRNHQGWGYPNLGTMYNNRTRTFVVDETEVMSQGDVHSYGIDVATPVPSLKVCLNWSEPGANPAAGQHLVNDLSLKVTSPNGVVYWGNHQLQSGVWSAAGGAEDHINTIECVFVSSPQVGLWRIDVIGTAIVADNHVETGTVDADYGLVAVGGTEVPAAFADFETFGDGCPGSFAPANPPCSTVNGLGGALTNTTSGAEHIHRAVVVGSGEVQSFSIWAASTGGTVTVDAWIYPTSLPDLTPAATTTLTIGPTPGFYTATFATPVPVASNLCYIGFDTSNLNVYRSELAAGTFGVGYSRPNPGAAWNVEVQKPSFTVQCTPQYETPAMTNSGLPSLGTTYSLDLVDALPSTFAVLVTGTSDSMFSGGPLPAPLPGAPGCWLRVSPDLLTAVPTSVAGTGSSPFSVPSATSLIGFELFHQYVVLDGQANAIGLVTSNAGKARIGQ